MHRRAMCTHPFPPARGPALGVYQAVGGTWNAGTHQFTVSDVQTGESGTPIIIDLAQKQRLLVNDTPTGWFRRAS